MTLQTPQPPPSALRAVQGALDCEATLGPLAALTLDEDGARLHPAHPLAVHVLDEPAAPLAGARRTGWRFLIEAGVGGPVAAAEVTETAERHHVFSHFTAGPYLDSTLRALRQAHQIAISARTRHHPRLLSIPGHYATALWLHHPDPGPAVDLLIPLAPAPLGITAHRVYPAGELLALLDRPLAPAGHS
ncbi:hypothetical protein ACIRBX_05400 [Kitasatospora sp. NPDC096147]|uniref:hypothetical protein n=1 Tax=Kitasatospora sp. NPDC096147 TaxID=3364093 RepID=UPI0037FB7AE0